MWTLVTIGVFTGGIGISHGPLAVLAFPVAMIALSTLRLDRSLERELRLAAAWSTLLAAAFWIAPYAADHRTGALGIPAALLTAIVAARHPAPTVISILALTGILGSIQAFTGIKAWWAIDLLLAGLWIALVIRLAVGKRASRYLLWPAVLACALYIFLTTLEVFTAPERALGVLSFRTSVWYMLAFLLLAYAGWSRETYRRIARGFVIVTALVAGYAVLRWLLGPAEAERQLATETSAGINLLDGHLRTVGSFITGHQLALWAGIMAPFSLAFALSNSGRWRLAAGVGTGLCVFAILASEVRGPLVGMAVGIVVVLALFAVARTSRVRPGAALAVAVAIIAAGGLAFGLTVVGPSASSERYARILDPGEDPAYQVREEKWSAALTDIHRHPFGQGLGTAGVAQQQGGSHLTIASFGLDSSYLKIAYEQGLVVMAFLVAALVLLLVRLGAAGVISADKEVAGLAIGATGALASMLVTFYTGIYIEVPPVLAGWMVLGLGLSGLVSVPAEAGAPSPVEGRPPERQRALAGGQTLAPTGP